MCDFLSSIKQQLQYDTMGEFNMDSKAQCDQINLLLLLLVCQAPLGVRSAKRSHQSPEWTILSHSYRLIQGEIV